MGSEVGRRPVVVPPIRCALFVPGIQARMLAKARESKADALWIDLEDASPPDKKDAARRLVREALPHYEQAVYVRVNAVETLMTADDVNAVVGPALDGIVLSKTKSISDVVIVDHLLAVAEQRASVPLGATKVIVTFEEVNGVLNSREILRSSDRVVGMVVGTAQYGDTERSLGYQWSAEGLETLYVRSKVLAEARAAGLSIIMEGPFVAHQDNDGLLRECRRSRQLGYTGKAAIHPRQVDLITQAFSPSAEDLAYYRRLVTAMEDAYARGVSAITFEGKLADTATLLLARQILASAERGPRAEGV